MQLDGLAAALRNEDVRKALLAMPAAPVQLAVYEWSGPGFQRVLQDWTAITDEALIFDIADRLQTVQRSAAPPDTALGTAMRFGAGLVAQRPACWKHTIDISGDGKHNTGPHPRDVQQDLETQSLTLNALVIGADTAEGGEARRVELGELVSYFSAWVLVGPDAFVETAVGFTDYEAAMVRKLLRELEGMVIASAGRAPDNQTRILMD